MSLFTTLPDELIFKIVSYFQGYSRRRQHIIERARDANTYDFLQIMMRERKLLGASGLKTDVKSIISFAETHPIFYQLIRKSNLGKIIWVNYYNSLFPLEIKENSIHIGPKRFPSCTNGPRCTNVLHYTNNERTGPVNWSIDSLFKKISVRSFVLMKNEAPDFTGNHQMTLDHAEIELARVLENIEKLKRRKQLASLELDEIFEPWITKSQASSYRTHKNRVMKINEQAKASESEEVDSLSGDSSTESYYSRSSSDED